MYSVEPSHELAKTSLKKRIYVIEKPIEDTDLGNINIRRIFIVYFIILNNKDFHVNDEEIIFTVQRYVILVLQW